MGARPNVTDHPYEQSCFTKARDAPGRTRKLSSGPDCPRVIQENAGNMTGPDFISNPPHHRQAADIAP